MSFKSYNALKMTIANWLARDDLESDIPDFIWLAECDVQRTVKFRLSDAIETGVTVADQSYIDLPDDYAEGGFLNWTSDTSLPTIEVVSYDVMAKIQKNPPFVATAGLDVRVGTLHGNRLHIGRAPGEILYELFYKRGVSHLGLKQQSNTILEQYPDVLLFGALLYSAPFLGADERIQTWVQYYDNAKEETRMQEWRARSGHGALRMRPDISPLR